MYRDKDYRDNTYRDNNYYKDKPKMREANYRRSQSKERSPAQDHHERHQKDHDYYGKHR